MEIGKPFRAPAHPGPTEPPRAAPPVEGAVRTALAAQAAVQPAGESPAVDLDLTRGAAERAALDAAIERRTVVDPRTRDFVYQRVDERTGEVVRQVPDETLLRLRAYSREMREKSEATDTRQVGRIA